MRFLLCAYAAGVETDFAKYAIVELTAPYIQMLEMRRDLWKKSKEQDMDLTEVVFWDPSVTYYDGIPKALLSQAEWATLHKDGVLLLSENFQLPDGTTETPTDDEKLVVDDDDVCWFARLEHLDFYVSTREIPYALFLPKETECPAT